MSKHRDLVPGIVERIRRTGLECGIVLVGSVSQGTERPESDVDFFVVMTEEGELNIPNTKIIHEEKGMQLIETHVEGITVHFAFYPADSFGKALDEEPHVYYPFIHGVILSDPAGIAKRYQEIARDYFDKNPRLVDAWEKQLEKVRRHRLDPGYKLEFPEWGDFAEHVEQNILRLEDGVDYDRHSE